MSTYDPHHRSCLTVDMRCEQFKQRACLPIQILGPNENIQYFNSSKEDKTINKEVRKEKHVFNRNICFLPHIYLGTPCSILTPTLIWKPLLYSPFGFVSVALI